MGRSKVATDPPVGRGMASGIPTADEGVDRYKFRRVGPAHRPTLPLVGRKFSKEVPIHRCSLFSLSRSFFVNC